MFAQLSIDFAVLCSIGDLCSVELAKGVDRRVQLETVDLEPVVVDGKVQLKVVCNVCQPHSGTLVGLHRAAWAADIDILRGRLEGVHELGDVNQLDIGW